MSPVQSAGVSGRQPDEFRLRLQQRHVEGGVMGHENGAFGKAGEGPAGLGHPRRAPGRAVSSIPWIFVEDGGIGRPGSTRVSKVSPPEIRRPPSSRTPAICTISVAGRIEARWYSVSKTTNAASDKCALLAERLPE